MESPDAIELTQLDDTGVLEKALALHKVKTAEASKRHVKIDEKFLGADTPETNQSDSKIPYEKRLITKIECEGRLAEHLPTWRKWRALVILFFVQISMNLNTSLYSNAIPGMANDFNRSQDATRWGATVFLIAYAFGCELWAPWSEELGRFWVLQSSLLLVNVFQFGVGFAKNLDTVIACRTLGGLSTAGGSISLGVLADMFNKEHHQIPVAFLVFASVGGSVLGPIAGGFVEANLSWHWAIWLQLLFGALVQAVHYFFVPETRLTIIMDRIAREKRAIAQKQGIELNLWGPDEIKPFAQRFSWKEISCTWLRPFKMFLTEPIVLTLSLLSGFSDALIFMQCFGLVYRQWNFSSVLIGLSFLPFLIGYLIAWLSFIPAIARNKGERANNPNSERAQFESRLWWLLFLAPCLPIGLIGFAWTSSGPPIHWFGSMVFTTLCGIANYAIYMATIDYMVTAYGPYSASATGGNGWARDFLAGVLTPAALPYYNLPLGSHHIEYASTILAGIATLLVCCVFIIYRYGPWLRHKSPFAQQIEAAEKEPETTNVIGVNYIPRGYGSAPASALQSKVDLTNLNRSYSQSTPNINLFSVTGFSRTGTPNRSRVGSRNASPAGRKKRPALGGRSKSLYHNQAQAERDVTVDHPALAHVRSSRSKSTSSADSTPAATTPAATTLAATTPAVTTPAVTTLAVTTLAATTPAATPPATASSTNTTTSPSVTSTTTPTSPIIITTIISADARPHRPYQGPKLQLSLPPSKLKQQRFPNSTTANPQARILDPNEAFVIAPPYHGPLFPTPPPTPAAKIAWAPLPLTSPSSPLCPAASTPVPNARGREKSSLSALDLSGLAARSAPSLSGSAAAAIGTKVLGRGRSASVPSVERGVGEGTMWMPLNE